ncbi:MAG TPA: cytochrome c [Vicinamibacterales bacterium]|nr:cytochrome c [Vicinamibacterales bacterium]
MGVFPKWSDPGLTPQNYQKTTKDRLYTKEQATRGAEQYVKFCEKCHTPEKVAAGKKPGPPVQGPKFLEAWVDRPLGELFGTIFSTMPSDGATTLTADQALDAVAHILQLNGYPDGPAPLKNDDVMKTAVIVK